LESEQAAKSIDAPAWTRRPGLRAPKLSDGSTAPTAGIVAVICAVLSTLTGCSGQSSFLTGGPTVGQLKASVSHLEYENEQLRKSAAKLERENRSMEDRLVQEQVENGDLTARLDDARNLLRDRGLESDVRVGSHRGGTTLGGSTSEGEDAERASLPDGSRKRPRKTPFAQISGGSDSVAPIEVDDPAADSEPSMRSRSRTRRSARQLDGELDQQSYHKASQSWMRVAESSDDSMIQIR
jgi:hypothetical protein